MALKYLDKKAKEFSIFVKKRDNKTIVEYDLSKIKVAITKANDSTEPNLSDVIPDDKLLPAIIDNLVIEIQKIVLKSIDYKAYPGKRVPKDIFDLRIEWRVDRMEYKAIINIETIQDLVIYTLITHGWINVAYRYIAYRSERTRIRENKNDFLEEILGRLKANDDNLYVHQANANIDDKSYGGRVGGATSTLMRKLALDSMSKASSFNHINNRIYIHDLDNFYIGIPNCLSISNDDLLQDGFDVYKNTDIRPAKSLSTAFQLKVVLSQLQSLNQFGGVASTHLDTTMVPFFRTTFNKKYRTVKNILSWPEFKKHDDTTKPVNSIYYKGIVNPFKYYIYKKALKLTIEELNQSVEGMYHNYNSLLSRSGKLDCQVA